MNIFKRIGIKIGEAARSIFGGRVAGADKAKKQAKALKRAGVKNAALKRFEKMQKIFKQKTGKSVYSKGLTENEKEQAKDIIDMFIEDENATLDGIKEQYEDLHDQGYAMDADNVADMAKQIDIIKNREQANRIYNVLGSDVVRDAWNNYKDNEENNTNVALMTQAINSVTESLEEDGEYMTLTSQERLDQIVSEYRRLKGE